MKYETVFADHLGDFAGVFYKAHVGASYLFCNSRGKNIFVKLAKRYGISIKGEILLWNATASTLHHVPIGSSTLIDCGTDYYEAVFADVSEFPAFETNVPKTEDVFKMLKFSKRGR